MVEQLQWGRSTLVLNDEAFARGFREGRKYYFESLVSSRARSNQLAATELLWLIAAPDEQGRYQLEQDGDLLTSLPEGVANVIGLIAGYLSGPLQPESRPERRQRLAELHAILQRAQNNTPESPPLTQASAAL
ncbi:hypothetical protein [Thermogemmatispora sp.]|jgi:hypothetical protein|uniref:hypothetical protein n=1 Tax=Thermogemmatispora sp. TaxID=1968838 RepID=UPI0035E40A1F